MRKRILPMVLSTLLITAAVSAFAGCGKTSLSGGEGQKTPGDSVESAEEPYTVTMVMTGTQQPDEERIEQKINEILMPELNMKLDLVVLPWGSSIQQIQLMLSGDEKIDFFYTDAQHALQYMNNGQIVDMTDLVDKYGNNLKQIFGEEVLQDMSAGGFTFGVPCHCENVSYPAIFMRKDLVEKYNIDASKIRSVEDLDDVFATVQAGEPDMDMLFSNGSTNGPMYRLGLSKFDKIGSFYGVIMDPAEGNTKVEDLFASDWFMDTAKLLYGWYQKGYINKDAATENESWNSLMKAGKVFSMITGDHPAIMPELESSTGYEYVSVRLVDLGVKMSNYYSDIIFSIAQNSEDPEKAMQCLDYIYGNADIMNLLNWGEEGIDYVFIDKENGLIAYPEGVNIENVGYSLNLGWEIPNGRIIHLWEGSDPNVNDLMEESNKQGVPSVAVGFVFDATGLDTQIAALDNVYNKYVPSIISGTVDPESYIPKLIEDMETAGLENIIEAKQEQFDAWLEEKK